MEQKQINNVNYDLEEKFEKLGEKIIILVKKACKNPVAFPLINQLIRSGTSIGANYMEANGASSKKDFKNKIHICKKEAKETMHWLRMLAIADENIKDECRILWQEVQGYAKMFSKIISTMQNNKN
ncbi:MAG: four helix bundle protein [Patescibacteria group bacterium]|nr:four helix bundle protein [Patescibacteria group bacterium]